MIILNSITEWIERKYPVPSKRVEKREESPCKRHFGVNEILTCTCWVGWEGVADNVIKPIKRKIFSRHN